MTGTTAFVNFRDVSHGLPPGTIREGILLRSDAPLGDAPMPEGVAWPPAAVVDLRHPSEVAEAHPLEPGAHVHRISLVDPTAPPPPGPAKGEGLRAFYDALFTPAASAGMAAAVRVIATTDGPTLVHCVAGKDRTGVTVALALRLLGVPRPAVLVEYLLTNRISADLAKRLTLHHQRMPEPPRRRPITVASVEAPAALLNDAMNRWDEHPHGPAGWLQDAGGDPDTIIRLRERLLPPLS